MPILPEQRYALTASHHSKTNESATDWSAELAASKLRDGIVHLTIDKLEEAQKNGHDLTPKDMVRLWNALIDAACKEGCGCAQVLRQHVSPS